MRTKEAKDFLVQQTVEQTALEGVSLSDLEKRMMYFVENDATSCAEPLKLNQEFEAQYDTEEYETKIASMLHHAYKGLKSEDPEKARQWDRAIRTISEGDHYLPVLWNTYPLRGSLTPLRESLPLLGAELLVAVVLLSAVFFAAKRDITLPRGLVMILLMALAVGAWLLFNWVRLPWVQRRAKHDKNSR